MLRRPEPKKLSESAQQQILQASAQQTGKATRVKSWDSNFPVFEVPVNQKILVYIPNHTIMSPDGTVGLRMDKFAAHPVIDGRTYGDIRCSSGVSLPELGLDETCPLCDGMNECWDLYRHEYEDIARSKGIDINSPEAAETLKQDRIDLVHKMAIKQAEIWYTFPIVVIDCEEKDGVLTTIPKKDAEGRISGKPMWYSIRERTYLDKWESGFDAMETDDGSVPTNPAGLWAILNFTYTSKSGNHDKMGSAKALKVTFKPMRGYEQWATYFDQLTEEWTPAKAMEVVVLDSIRNMQEMKEVADSLLKPVRDRLAMYQLGMSANAGVATGAGALPNTSADAALAGFGGATPVTNAPAGELPNANAGAGTPPVAPVTSGELPGDITAEMPSTGVATE